MSSRYAEYAYQDASETCAHHYIWPELQRIIARLPIHDKRVLDLGCGNGATTNYLTSFGFAATGIEPSESGVAIARASYPHIQFHKGDGYEELDKKFGQFPLVVCLEVIEHIYAPRQFAKNLYDSIQPGGFAIMSTPYHGYLKNLALAVTGKWDSHLTALWDGGHIKFWSMKTLTILLKEVGFRRVTFSRVGRIAPLAKSMVAVAQKQ